jgi:hypothetical protein
MDYEEIETTLQRLFERALERSSAQILRRYLN